MATPFGKEDTASARKYNAAAQLGRPLRGSHWLGRVSCYGLFAALKFSKISL
jgi:hypothetical protein